MNIGFIGAGKVGCTLGKYFAKAPQVTIKGYYSRSSRSADEAARFTESKSYRTMKELIEACDTIFLTVPDGSIQDTWKKVREYDIREKMICHCSGAMSSRAAFEGIEETGAFGYSAHPLFAVSDKYNAYRELTDVFFTLDCTDAGERAQAADRKVSRIEGQDAGTKAGRTDRQNAGLARLQDAGLTRLRGLLEALGNPTRIIAGEDKTTYHCAAAMASNLVCGLIDQSIDLMKRCGFAEEEAVKALAPILTGNIAHIAEKGPTASLTGPMERNDTETIRKHLLCLTDEGENQLYRLISNRLLHMAQERHPERDYGEMSRLIQE